MKYFLIFFLFSSLFLGNLSYGKEGGSYKKMLDSLGSTIFFFAWPSATYKRGFYEGSTPMSNSYLVTFKLEGVSTFSGGKLWTEVILEMKNNEIIDMRWGKNNAILLKPGETIKFLGEVLKELNEKNSSANRFSNYEPTSQGYDISVYNKCHKEISLAIRYRNTSGDWVTKYWWNISPHESNYLSSDGGRLKTNSSILYYYARAGSMTWDGFDNTTVIDGEEYSMRKHNDNSGDTNIVLSCD